MAPDAALEARQVQPCSPLKAAQAPAPPLSASTATGCPSCGRWASQCPSSCAAASLTSRQSLTSCRRCTATAAFQANTCSRTRLTPACVQAIIPIMRKYTQVELCLECSSKKLRYTSEVFAYAVKSVLNPVAPVYDPHANGGQGALKEACVKALRRIFIMCDKDKVCSVAPACIMLRCVQ